ncbi:MAG: N-acetylneuraminate synthase family protein [Lachnospiraceae bacterium]|nr:N-acetylneuraminate synthase family protein [Lachnospiraceae bacterium]
MESTIIDRLRAGKFVLIAEIGVNYYDIADKKGISPMDAAKLMIGEAKDAGIHAVKFQTYKAGTLAAKESPSYWDRTEEPTASQYELFKKFDSFGEPEYRELKEYADSLGIEFLSTAFDFESADYLYDLMNVYKISSSDLSNIPFIEYQAKKGKPMLLSIGASDLPEIERAVDTIRSVNESELALLHCVLEYPTPLEHANLRKIQTLKQQFPDCYIGYSDHTKPTEECDVAKVAYNMGAQLIEKHFTLDKTLTGNDHYHAMDPSDAKAILAAIERMEMLCGNGELVALESEASARENARRSIVAACNIDEGDLITRNMLTFKRPGTGISPSEIGRVVGRTAACDISEDTILQEDMLKAAAKPEPGEQEMANE